MAEAFSKLGGKDLYVEAWAEFEKELAVMVRQLSQIGTTRVCTRTASTFTSMGSKVAKEGPQA